MKNPVRSSQAARAATLATILGVAWLGCGPARAATLDAVADGNDVVLTWDAGPTDLLRGSDAANLTTYLTAVASPLRLVDENLPRGEHAFYRLASGSNMAFRIERTFTGEDAAYPGALPVTLPERREAVTGADLLAEWPDLAEVLWWDGSDQRFESVARIGGVPMGDADPLPRHGGVWLSFSRPVTVTLVGSHDEAYGGPTEADLRGLFGVGYAVLPLPPHARRVSGWEVLCGEAGLDWMDGDGNTIPDECGRDLDADGDPDTGLYGGGDNPGQLTLARPPNAAEPLGHLRVSHTFQGAVILLGTEFRVIPGGGCFVATMYNMRPNAPFRPPTW